MIEFIGGMVLAHCIWLGRYSRLKEKHVELVMQCVKQVQIVADVRNEINEIKKMKG